MAKVKYYYDSDTLSYKKVVLRKRDKFKKFLVFFLGAISFGLIFMFISFQFVESPK